MKRIVLSLMVALSIASFAQADDPRPGDPLDLAVLLATADRTFESFADKPPPKQCCRICRKSKACGDTCIAFDRVCHVGPGCACDAEVE
jgi:hypothetical protein